LDISVCVWVYIYIYIYMCVCVCVCVCVWRGSTTPMNGERFQHFQPITHLSVKITYKYNKYRALVGIHNLSMLYYPHKVSLIYSGAIYFLQLKCQGRGRDKLLRLARFGFNEKFLLPQTSRTSHDLQHPPSSRHAKRSARGYGLNT